MSQMTIHRALVELKTLDSRISAIHNWYCIHHPAHRIVMSMVEDSDENTE